MPKKRRPAAKPAAAKPSTAKPATARPSRQKSRTTAKKPANTSAGTGDNAPSVILYTPTGETTLRTADPAVNLARAAMQWTYVVRNRQRWSAVPSAAERQSQAAAELLERLGVDPDKLLELARAGMVEVSIPWTGNEADNWPDRIFPWEYVIAGATHALRGGEPLTLMRHLRVGAAQAVGGPLKRALFVASDPGPLNAIYDFGNERDLLRKNLQIADSDWRELHSPTTDELANAVASLKPDIVHLAGFDMHLAADELSKSKTPDARKIEQWEGTARWSGTDQLKDGYVLSGTRLPYAAGAEELAQLLSRGGHRPQLVSINIGNSAARIAPMVVAAGAQAAIGFQDSFDDDLAELFFAMLYARLNETGWSLPLAFRAAWERVRSQPTHRQGTGVVLWSADRLLTQAPAQQYKQRTAELKKAEEKALDPETLSAGEASDTISVIATAYPDVNYSVLHNRRRLFDTFSLKSQRPIRNINVSVELNVGPETASYRRTLNLNPPAEDIKDKVLLPLTSALARTVQETVLSSMLIEVTWGPHVLFCDTQPVRLTPVDQWRDNKTDGQWLPSFVFPRDPAVTRIVDLAQRYVRVLRDDPTAGFDGYQSFDEATSDSTEVDLQVQAIWSAIVHELRLGYINPPPGYSTELDSQRLRTPSMIAAYHSGTCIDLALFFSACLELVDIYPVIFLLQGHAFPGYWRSDAYLEDFRTAHVKPEEMTAHAEMATAGAVAQSYPWVLPKDAFREIVQHVNAGNLVPLETVRLTENSGFWEAVDAGRENLNDENEFDSMIDIAIAREKQVTPLPILGERS